MAHISQQCGEMENYSLNAQQLEYFFPFSHARVVCGRASVRILKVSFVVHELAEHVEVLVIQGTSHLQRAYSGVHSKQRLLRLHVCVFLTQKPHRVIAERRVNLHGREQRRDSVWRLVEVVERQYFNSLVAVV